MNAHLKAGNQKRIKFAAIAYSKGERSFEVLAKLDPAVLKQYLPSFVRVDRILQERL